MFNVKGHYRIAAFILEYQFTQIGEEQVKSGFKKDCGEDFTFLKGKIEEAGEDEADILK